MGSKANLKIRINIDSENEGEIISLLEYLNEKIKDKKNVQLVIAPVQSFGDNNLKNYMEVISQLYNAIKGYNFKFDIMNYLFKKESCMAPYKSHYAIDIYGDVYKCISLSGKREYKDGYLDYNEMEIKYNDRILDFMTFNPIFNPDCKDCIYLPVCRGGCVIQQNREIYTPSDRSICLLKDKICKDNYNKLIDNILDIVEGGYY